MKSNDLNVLDILSNTTGHDLMIDLSDNQLTCDCSINDFHDWLKRTKVKINNLNTLSCFNRVKATKILCQAKISSKMLCSRTYIQNL
ncbi:CLUMA_CG011492, isoform A [Clunio marinus]|uniref:CLUMA_CG011492, isoform A n=1 Tax=Clunio marinus TaxID=568069 RepID=A0A1J1IEZ3_9DIPT|nr:CLUMA_CG011492, isoform A [Clunio marinus]